MIDVGWLPPGNQWDQTMLEDLLTNQLYPTGLEFRRWENYPQADGCILIIPGRYHHTDGNRISETINKYRWVLAIRTGDEEDLLDPYQIWHPNIRWWIQTPHPGKDYGDARFIGIGYPPHFRHLPAQPVDKQVEVFLSAQNTHSRRKQCFKALRGRPGSVIHETQGFTQGLPPEKYRHNMLAAKIAPAPGGPESPDTFRLYEALEAQSVPIADDLSPKQRQPGYWHTIYPDAPFPILTSYESLNDYIRGAVGMWPANTNRIHAWWMRQKRAMALNLVDDLKTLGAL